MSEKKKAVPEPKTPGIGRIVIFVDADYNHHRAAIITHVWNPERVNLFVFPDASFPLLGDTFTSVSFDTEGRGYTWHWIEKE